MAYTAVDVTRLVGISTRRLRAYVEEGLVHPTADTTGALLFGFQDLVLLKAAKGLHDANIPPARIRQALRKLRADLPTGRPLSALSISAWGNRIVVREGNTRFHPESGQALFNFDIEELERETTRLEEHKNAIREAAGRRQAQAGDDAYHDDENLADMLYEEALLLEETDFDAAMKKYDEALELAPEFVEAHVNLGRLYHERDDYLSAEAHYRMALEVRPSDSLALFNLAVALEDQARLEEAVAHYEMALAHDPSLTDAHYNLARIYDAQGDRGRAARHLRALSKLGAPS